MYTLDYTADNKDHYVKLQQLKYIYVFKDCSSPPSPPPAALTIFMGGGGGGGVPLDSCCN